MAAADWQAIRGLLFDKDGTLIDFEASWQALFERFALEVAGGDAGHAARLLEQAGYDEAAGRFRAGSVIAAGTTVELVELWQPDLDREARKAAVGHMDAQIVQTASSTAVAVCDLAPVLGGLAATGRFRLGVATNDAALSAERCLAQLGVRDMFDAVIGWDSVERAKPAPDMVHAFCRRCGLEPAEVAVIGDNMHDLEMAEAAGAGLRIGVLSGNSAHDDLAPLAHAVIEDISHLPRIAEIQAAALPKEG